MRGSTVAVRFDNAKPLTNEAGEPIRLIAADLMWRKQTRNTRIAMKEFSTS
jgi:hypothetical protein